MNRKPLFDSFAPKSSGYARADESTMSYFARSDRPEVGRVREVLEAWFARYPADESLSSAAALRASDRLRGLLMARRNRQQLEAWWELHIHECLRRAGCSIRVNDGTPDFFATYDGYTFGIEATVRGESAAEEACANRVAKVRGEIEKIDCGSLYLHVGLPRSSSSVPRHREIRSVIERWLADINAGRVTRSDPHEFEAMFEVDGWPFSVAAVRLSGRGGIGSWGNTEATVVQNREKLLDALKSKAAKLPEEPPTIIAILNDREFARDEHAIEALIGSTSIVVEMNPHEMKLGAARNVRNADGFWTPRGGSGRHVLGVLMADSMGPSSFLRARPSLWMNPWKRRTRFPLPAAMPWEHVWFDEAGARCSVDGGAASAFFELDSDWPMLDGGARESAIARALQAMNR